MISPREGNVDEVAAAADRSRIFLSCALRPWANAPKNGLIVLTQAWTSRACASQEEIARYRALDRPKRATKFTTRIYKATTRRTNIKIT